MTTTPPGVPAPTIPVPDPRLAGPASRLPVDRLPPAGPLATPLGGEPFVFLDDDQPGILWADAATPVASVKRAPIGLAVRGPAGVGMTGAAVLGDARCATWLAQTKATLADIARADSVDFAHDPRLCGASPAARLQTAQTAQGVLYLRTRAKEPSCERLHFVDGTLVRDGSSPDRPELAFTVAIDEGSLALAGPLGTPEKDTFAVTCKTTYKLVGDDPTGADLTYAPLARWPTPPPQKDRLFVTEAACLAAPPAAGNAADCLRTVLAATSSAKDLVVDRIAPMIKHGKPVFWFDGKTCRTVPFGKTVKTKDAWDHWESATGYHRFFVATSWTRLSNTMGDGDFGDDTTPVVQTTGDFVWVGADKWFLSQAACQRAATSR